MQRMVEHIIEVHESDLEKYYLLLKEYLLVFGDSKLPSAQDHQAMTFEENFQTLHSKKTHLMSIDVQCVWRQPLSFWG